MPLNGPFGIEMAWNKKSIGRKMKIHNQHLDSLHASFLSQISYSKANVRHKRYTDELSNELKTFIRENDSLVTHPLPLSLMNLAI